MDRGRLVERGTNRELLAAAGHYARVYEEQFRPQEEADRLRLNHTEER